MDTKLCIGNLGDDVTSDDLRQLFSHYGQVKHAKVMLDRHTGRSRGFGLIELANVAEAKAAVSALDGSTFAGHAIHVGEHHVGPHPGEFGDRSGKGPCSDES